MEIGSRLSELRKKHGYTQKQLAEALNLSQQIVSNIERNTTAPDVEFLHGAADLYKISLDELIGRKTLITEESSYEQQILNVVEMMDDTKKELSLRLLSEVKLNKEVIRMANSYFNENTLEELIEEIKYVYKSDNRPWIIGYSGGKDSTTVVELVYKMLLGLKSDERHKNVYIVSSDTLIENPLIKIYLSKMNDLLGEAADRDGIPIKSAMVTPVPNNSFWANVIGRGFPTPRMNGTFRWCTDRLKINPSGEYIQKVIDDEGKEVVVLLGVRKAESIARKRRIEGRELANRLLNRHETIQKAYVYNPNCRTYNR